MNKGTVSGVDEGTVSSVDKGTVSSVAVIIMYTINVGSTTFQQSTFAEFAKALIHSFSIFDHVTQRR